MNKNLKYPGGIPSCSERSEFHINVGTQCVQVSKGLSLKNETCALITDIISNIIFLIYTFI